jgi:glycosyltransferase involved in cell wall biosynthesis
MQIHTARLTRALAERGVEQIVVTAHRPGAPRSEELTPGARVVRVGARTRAFRQLYVPAAVPAVAGASRRTDLVHVHLGEDLGVLALGMWAASRAGAPLVVTVHCSLRFTVRRHDARTAALSALGSPLERWAEETAAAVLVLTPRLATLLERSGVARSRIHVVPLGIDLRTFGRAHPRPPELGPGRWVVYVGRLVRPKGVRELLTAFARLRAPAARLLFVGDGPERRPLEALARALGVAERVHVVGAVPHARVPEVLQSADVVVLPS